MPNQTTLNKIKEKYNLPNVKLQNKVDRGYLSNNYVLKNKDQNFFLKQYRYSTKSKIKQILNITDFFHSNGTPTIKPLTNNQNKRFTTIDNGHFSLFPYIDKKEVNRGEVNKKVVKSIAETLAKVHQIGQTDDLPQTERKNISWSKEKLNEKAEQVNKVIADKDHFSQYDKLAKHATATKLKLSEKYPIPPSELNLKFNCLIHGDLYCENVFLNEQDEVEYVYDWEKAKIAPRCYEIIRSMMYTIFDKIYNEQALNKAKLHLKTYKKNYKLTNKQIEVGIKAIILKDIYSMWILEEYYLKDNKRVKPILETELERIKFFGNNLEEVIDKFKI